ncbi:MAG TPA: Crp/Fnr family transcriptional regulator [Chitinophagaceae bacterium]|nr:Crp/Fnr family transcriptional regulator [Chitinophagaceae bacterium]
MNLQNQFSGFEPELIEAIEKEAVPKTFAAGEVIMRTGQYIKSTILVLEGRIKIYRESDEGGEFLMYYLGPGDACAISMICALQSSTSEVMAVAEEETSVILVPLQLMEQLMTRFKSWYQFVIRTYRARFDELLAVIDHVAFRNMDERLEFYLKRYADETGRRMITLSHQEIASDLNTSREVVSRLLKKMEQRNLVKLHRNMVELL